MRHHVYQRLFNVAAIFSLISITTPAQVAGVRGKVVDASGASVSGAPVVLQAQESSSSSQVLTDANGAFTFTGRLPGTYTILVAAFKGFADQTVIVVLQAQSATVNIVLQAASVTDTVEVGNGNPMSTSASANQDSVAVAASTLDHLPVFDQDIAGALTPFLDPAATSSTGVSIVVDGMEMKNGANVTSSAIAEVRVNSEPYSAEFASPGRGRLEITTKPGSPKLHGTLNVIARDSGLNASNYFAPVKPAEQRRIFEGHLTGPLGTARHTTFLLTGTNQAEDLQATVHATTPTELVQANFSTPNTNDQASGRVTHDFSDRNRLAASYHFQFSSQTGRNVGGLVLPEAAIDETNRQDQLIFNDRVLVSPTLVQQLQVLLELETDSQSSERNAPSIVVQDAFTGGGGQTDIYRTEHTLGLIDVVSWSHGRQYVRFGITVPQISRRAVEDRSQRLGVYSFLSLADYSAAHPFRYLVQQGRGRATYFATEVASFAQDEITLRKNLQLTVGVRYQFQTYLNDGGNFAPRASLAYAPAKNRVLRAGAGIFYDRSGGDFPVTYKLHNGVVLRQYQIMNPAYPVITATSFAGYPTNIAQLQPDSSAAYQVQYSATAERQLADGLTATATYRGIIGIKTFRSRDPNAPLPPSLDTRPNPALGFVQQVEAEGRSRLNALDLGLRGALKRGKVTWFEGQVQYTLSRFENNTGGINWYPQDQYDPDAEYGRADLDRRQRFNLLGDVHPGHWLTLGVAAALYSGLPYTELAGVDVYGTGLGNARPAGVRRNTLQGSGTASVDLLWDHDFTLTQASGDAGQKLNLSAAAFNAINHPNLTNYVGSVRSSLFRSATTALPGRQLQFGLRYSF